MRPGLTARGASLQQVVEAVRGANIIDSPGLLEENHQLELTLVSGQAMKPEELERHRGCNRQQCPCDDRGCCRG
jgi:hypothetical protein